MASSISPLNRCHNPHICAVADWPRHKADCKVSRQFNTHAGSASSPIDETPLHRHARLFTERFWASLAITAAAALELHCDWAALDRRACLLTLQPRPHANAGARFVLREFKVISMAEFRDVYAGAVALSGGVGAGAVEALFANHAAERERMRASTGGEADYATAAAFFNNTGPLPLPPDENPPMTLKFIPLHVYPTDIRALHAGF
jgi:hypothetical protein